jgi:hypothetical protein
MLPSARYVVRAFAPDITYSDDRFTMYISFILFSEYQFRGSRRLPLSQVFGRSISILLRFYSRQIFFLTSCPGPHGSSTGKLQEVTQAEGAGVKVCSRILTFSTQF